MSALWPSPSFGTGLLPDRVSQGAVVNQAKSLTTETSFDLGPPQKRSIGTGLIETLDFTMILKTDAVVNELMSFHDSILANGVLKFRWNMPNAHGIVREFQFRSRPQIVWVEADIWSAQVSLRVFPL